MYCFHHYSSCRSTRPSQTLWLWCHLDEGVLGRGGKGSSLLQSGFKFCPKFWRTWIRDLKDSAAEILSILENIYILLDIMWQIITYVKCLCIFSNLKMHQVGWMEPPNGLVLTRRPFVWQPLFRKMNVFIHKRTHVRANHSVCMCVWKGCTHPCGTAGFYRNIWYLSQHVLMGTLHRCVLPRSAHPSGTAQTFSQSWCRTSGRPCRCLKQSGSGSCPSMVPESPGQVSNHVWGVFGLQPRTGR